MRPTIPARVHVCPLRLVPEMIERTGARHLVSAINAELLPATPASIAAERHLRLAMHDIVDDLPDFIPPAREHVLLLIDFVHAWDQQDPMLIHCYAGISRSTAAAFIALCVLNPGCPEATIARRLRHCSDSASPNRRFVALADKALRRDGRMIEAVARMGNSRMAAECVPFEVEARHEDVRHVA